MWMGRVGEGFNSARVNQASLIDEPAPARRAGRVLGGHGPCRRGQWDCGRQEMGGTGELGLYGYGVQMGTSSSPAGLGSRGRPAGSGFPASCRGRPLPRNKLPSSLYMRGNGRQTSYEVMRLISACRVARYTSCRLAGYWRLGFWRTQQSKHTHEAVESSQVIAQGRKKLPSPNTKKKENENHHSAGQSLSVPASLQSCFTGREHKVPPGVLRGPHRSPASPHFVCPPRVAQNTCPCCRHRIASPSIPDGPLSGPVLALALALAHCHSPPF